MQTKWRSIRQSLTSILFMTALIAGCFGGIIAAADQVCVSNAKTWIPRYPGSKVIEEEYGFVRPFGMGTTSQVLYSEDDENTIRQWYGATRRAAGRDGAKRGFNAVSWRVEPADSGGSYIYLNSKCGG